MKTGANQIITTAPGQTRRFRTISGREIAPVYPPPDGAEAPDPAAAADPGVFPYTRGIHASGYHGKLWTMRQFAGFGTPEETNARYRHLLEAGGTGLSVAFDLPTLMGRDPDHELSLGEVGKCGVSVVIARRHGGALHGHPARPRHDVDDDQLAGGDDLRDVPGRGRTAGRPMARALRHDPERHPEGVHRAEGVHLPAAPVDAPCHRRVLVLRDAKSRAGTRFR